MGKYKVGDIVKLSTGDKGIVKDVKLEKVYYPSPIYGKDEVKEEYKYKCEIENDDTYDLYEKEIIGLWKEKHVAQIIFETMNNNDSFPKKIKLIDVLNKIANGELKEGTKIIWDGDEFVYGGEYGATKNSDGYTLWDCAYIGSLNDEVELIEPNQFREDTKLMEPTDNTKIEELDENKYILKGMADVVVDTFYKLNEVIRYINKGG